MPVILARDAEQEWLDTLHPTAAAERDSRRAPVPAHRADAGQPGRQRRPLRRPRVPGAAARERAAGTVLAVAALSPAPTGEAGSATGGESADRGPEGAPADGRPMDAVWTQPATWEGVGGQGPAEVVALGEVAAQQGELLQRGSSSTPSAMILSPRSWPRLIVERTMIRSLSSRSIGETKERSILSSLIGQPAQVGQRRVAGPEIIHGHPDAEVAQARHRRQRALGVGHDHALGDLELECLGGTE